MCVYKAVYIHIFIRDFWELRAHEVQVLISKYKKDNPFPHPGKQTKQKQTNGTILLGMTVTFPAARRALCVVASGMLLKRLFYF